MGLGAVVEVIMVDPVQQTLIKDTGVRHCARFEGSKMMQTWLLSLKELLRQAK